MQTKNQTYSEVATLLPYEIKFNSKVKKTQHIALYSDKGDNSAS